MRSETAAFISPRPVQEKAATRMTSARAGTADAGMSTPRIRVPAVSENADTNAAFRTTGTARPKKSGMRRAGLTRIALSVFWNRSPLTSWLIAKRHGIAAYWRALPTT
jgi:hypothetical protein